MRHAHFIMVHADIPQLDRLLHNLAHPENLFLVHLDSKSPPSTHEAVSALRNRHANLHLMPPRDVRWASWSVVDTTLAGIAHLLEIDPDWTHFSNLSGQDLPLWPQQKILQRLREHPQRNFVETFDPRGWVKGEDRIRHVRIEPPWPRRGFTLPKLMLDRWPRILGDVRYWGGSSYFTLTRAFCEHMLSSSKLPAFKRFFRYSYSADEIFLPSFILDSPFAETVVNDNLRLIDFSAGLPRPHTWTMADRERLLGSDKLYARKFDPNVDAEIIDLIEQRLLSTSL